MTTPDPTCTSWVSPAAQAGKPPLADRPLISLEKAGELVGLFKVLGNDTRLRLLHAIHRDGEVSAGELAAQVEMQPQAISNQLRRLSDRRIVSARRNGNRIHYSIADPCVPALLDLAICLTEETGAGDGAR